MKYVITVYDYELDENGKVMNRYGGRLCFNDADDFVMMWNYFIGCGAGKDFIDDGKVLLMRPRDIGPFVTDYQVQGEAYKLLKKREAEAEERYKNSINNNKEELPF